MANERKMPLYEAIRCYRVKCYNETPCNDRSCFYNCQLDCDPPYCAYNSLLFDAENKLRNSAPQILSKEELIRTATYADDACVWLEPKTIDPDSYWHEGWVEPCTTSNRGILQLFAFGIEVPVMAALDAYGISWRCWTGKPDRKELWEI